MVWHTLYNEYSKMNESELRDAILSLTDIGTGHEVTDVFSNVDNAEIRLRLIEKAVELGVGFTEADYLRLDDQIPSALYVKIAKIQQYDLRHSGGGHRGFGGYHRS